MESHECECWTGSCSLSSLKESVMQEIRTLRWAKFSERRRGWCPNSCLKFWKETLSRISVRGYHVGGDGGVMLQRGPELPPSTIFPSNAFVLGNSKYCLCMSKYEMYLRNVTHLSARGQQGAESLGPICGDLGREPQSVSSCKKC